MWKDKVIKRTPREEFIEVCDFMGCGPRCPQYGHRMRLEAPDYFNVEIQAESRVRALHAVLSIRASANELAGQADLADLFEQLANFSLSYDPQATGVSTHHQLANMRIALAKFIARRLTWIKHEMEVLAYKDGLSRVPFPVSG